MHQGNGSSDRPTKKQRKLEEEGQNPSDAEKQNRKHSPKTTFLTATYQKAEKIGRRGAESK
jgi:hypothetical protein